tara:strand:- start:97 stop:666 length:570 start_codon:yes stop_codon:yes gene_type:complete
MVKYIVPFIAAALISCSPNNCSNKDVSSKKMVGAEKVLSPLEQQASKIGIEALKFGEDVKTIGKCGYVNLIKECRLEGIAAGPDAVFEKIVYHENSLEIHSVYTKKDKIVELENPSTGELNYGRKKIRAIDYINKDPPKHLYRRWEVQFEGGRLNSNGELEVEWKDEKVMCQNSLGEQLKVKGKECVLK